MKIEVLKWKILSLYGLKFSLILIWIDGWFGFDDLKTVKVGIEGKFLTVPLGWPRSARSNHAGVKGDEKFTNWCLVWNVDFLLADDFINIDFRGLEVSFFDFRKIENYWFLNLGYDDIFFVWMSKISIDRF